MFESVLSTMNAFKNVWTANMVISDLVSNVESGVETLLAGEQQQKTSSKGITQKKAQTRSTLEETALAMAHAGRAYGVQINDTQLKVVCKLSASELRNAKAVDLIAVCQNLYDAISSFAADLALYGVTSTSLADFQTAIDAFTKLTGQPASAMAAISAATKSIELQIKTIKNLLDEELDPLMTQFKTSEPIFYTQYMSSRMIHDIGVRHTVRLKGIVYSAGGKALASTLVKLSGASEREKTTAKDGSYKFFRLHTGTYTITIKATGFITQSKTFDVMQNGIVENDFVMVETHL